MEKENWDKDLYISVEECVSNFYFFILWGLRDLDSSRRFKVSSLTYRSEA